MSKITKTTLKNNITLITKEKPDTYNVSMNIKFNVGSYNEKQHKRGIAHFIEHMLFKGTTNRTYQQINREIAMAGGDLNASTGFTETCYLADTPFDKWKNALDILLDLVNNPLFDKKEIEKERTVILEEMIEYEDDADSLAVETLFKNMNNGIAERNNIIGTKESVSSITREDLLKFYNQYYQEDNMTIIIVGKINHEEIVEFIENYKFKEFTPSVIETVPFAPVELLKQDYIFKPRPYTTIAWGFLLPKIKEEGLFINEVITTLLTGHMASRLYQHLREEQGLVYGVESDTISTNDTSMIFGSMSLDEENRKKALKILKLEYQRLADELVSDEELELTKNYMKGNFLRVMERSSAEAMFILVAQHNNLTYSIEDYLTNINNVSAKAIQDFARLYLDIEDMYTVEIRDSE